MDTTSIIDKVLFLHAVGGTPINATDLAREFQPLAVPNLADQDSLIQPTQANLDALWGIVQGIDRKSPPRRGVNAFSAVLAEWLIGRPGQSTRPSPRYLSTPKEIQRMIARGMPRPGRYRLLAEFEIEGATMYGGFEGGEVIETGLTKYRTGDVIEVERCFWSSESNAWGAKVLAFHQYRSIPMAILQSLD